MQVHVRTELEDETVHFVTLSKMLDKRASGASES